MQNGRISDWPEGFFDEMERSLDHSTRENRLHAVISGLQ